MRVDLLACVLETERNEVPLDLVPADDTLIMVGGRLFLLDGLGFGPPMFDVR